MSELLPGIHLVEGVDPSKEFSTHVYLVSGPRSEWTLLDAGLPGSETPIAAYLKAQRIDPHAVRTILVTHLHRDHTGGLRKVAELTGAKTFAHWIDAAYIEMHPPYGGKGVPPAEPFSVTERLKDGDRIDAAGGIVAYHTPGHTPGHTSYYLPDRQVLVTGDLFMGHGPELLLTVPEYTHDGPTATISARRVAALPIEKLLTYHGGPFLDGARKRLDRLVERL